MTRFAIAWLLITLLVPPLAAQDFRVETDVFDGGEKPVAEYLTLFQGDKIYDFLLTGPQEVSLLDLNRGRFILIDPERKVKTELLTHDLHDLNQQLLQMASLREADLFHPNFKISEEESWIVLKGERITYRVQGSKPRFPEAAQRYREFADWYAQLNAIRPANLPPFGRMELNRVVAERGLIPDDIEREVTVNPLSPKRKVRSHHAVYWALNAEDQRRMRGAENDIATFTPISPDEYFQLNKLAGGDKKQDLE